MVINMATVKKTNSVAEQKKERVTVFIPHPLDSTGDTETVVGVNGKLYQIQYDKQVSVPPEVAAVINQSSALNAKISEAKDALKMKPGKSAFAEL